MSKPILELRSASKTHGSGALQVHALIDANLQLQPGQFAAIMGPSGSGKSTLLHLAGGLDAPTQGSVVIDGTDISTMASDARAKLRRRSVGYVFQDFNLLPALTAIENVAFPLELDGWARSKAFAAAAEALADMGIADLAERLPEEMSGGQAQRVAIARAVVGPRRLILADEPTGALDSATGLEVLQLLRVKAAAGAAVLMVTHESRFAAHADCTYFLRDGRIIDVTGPTNFDTFTAEGPR